MKKFITLFIVLVSHSIIAQWVQQSTPTTENLNDVFCITENIVIVVGDNGTILKTTDGGANWVQKISGTTSSLTKVKFASSNIGYAIGNVGDIGNNSSIIKTLDGGENWSSVINGESYIGSFSVIDENIVYYVANGVVKKTTDGGVSFVDLNSNEFIENIQFINQLVGYASSGSSLIKTINGGMTWTNIGNVDIYSPSNNIASFHFFNQEIGFVKKFNEIYRTTDGGLNYTYLSTVNYYMPRLFASNENVVWGITVDLLLNGQPNYTTRVETFDENNFERIDAGSPLLKSVNFINPTKGYGVAWGGEIYKNATGTMLGISDFKNEKKSKIYPNPTSNEINITLNESALETFSIEIVDSLGKKVFFQKYNNTDNIKINIKTLTKGIYFLSIIYHEKRETQKLIIN